MKNNLIEIVRRNNNTFWEVNGFPSIFQEETISSLFFLYIFVPIASICFDSNKYRWNCEIDTVSSDGVFANKIYSKSFERFPYDNFYTRWTPVSSVTRYRNPPRKPSPFRARMKGDWVRGTLDKTHGLY
jgi:hypothetical protein